MYTFIKLGIFFRFFSFTEFDHSASSSLELLSVWLTFVRFMLTCLERFATHSYTPWAFQAFFTSRRAPASFLNFSSQHQNAQKMRRLDDVKQTKKVHLKWREKRRRRFDVNENEVMDGDRRMLWEDLSFEKFTIHHTIITCLRGREDFVKNLKIYISLTTDKQPQRLVFFFKGL